MSSILDIDLDYFVILDDPTKRLKDILEWANRPIDFIVEEHHRVLRRWEVYIKKGMISPPRYILHVDEHHDMMDEKKMPNIANVVYQAMPSWRATHSAPSMDVLICPRFCPRLMRLRR